MAVSPLVRYVALRETAPAKPPPGAPCNGCGICCALEPCPLGRLRFLQSTGPCPALRWSAWRQGYRCGLLRAPRLLWRRLPAWTWPLVRRLIARAIAAGQGCDCSAQVEATAETAEITTTLPPRRA